jgi:hypothetical protein
MSNDPKTALSAMMVLYPDTLALEDVVLVEFDCAVFGFVTFDE